MVLSDALLIVSFIEYMGKSLINGYFFLLFFRFNCFKWADFILLLKKLLKSCFRKNKYFKKN